MLKKYVYSRQIPFWLEELWSQLFSSLPNPYEVCWSPDWTPCISVCNVRLRFWAGNFQNICDVKLQGKKIYFPNSMKKYLEVISWVTFPSHLKKLRFYNEILKTQGKKSNKITTFLHALSTTDNQFQIWPLFIAGCNFLMSVIWQVKKFWTMLYCTETKHLIWI